MPLPETVDLLITGGDVLSVQTGEVWPADVAVVGDRVRAVLPPGTRLPAAEVLDARGLVVAPGYVDAHMHIESSLLAPREFARVTLPRGTTTVLADAHEIVNVAGREAQAWMIQEGRATAQTMRWAVPSCVPALDGFETAGARLDADDIDEMLGWEDVTTLGEVMDYRAVVDGDPRMHAIVAAARRHGVRLDGHCPNLSGADLGEYLWAGIDSDHCKNTPEVAVEKARLGMLLMLQEKCLTPEVVDALLGLPHLPDLCLVTDDVAADAILERGHLDHVGGVALRRGLPPVAVLRALTLHPARRLGLHDRGVVSPGKRADLVLLRSLTELTPAVVVAGGRIAGRDGRPLSGASVPDAAAPQEVPFSGTVRLAELGAGSADWRVDLPDGEHVFRALRVNEVDTYTEPAEVRLPVRGGLVDWEGRTAVVAVFERHTGSGRMNVAPVVGHELGAGAFATTYAHDSHNLTVIATSGAALRAAANSVIAAGGGMSVVRDGADAVTLPLPIGGVMSPAPADEVAAVSGRVRDALLAWGWRNRNVFMSVSTLTLPVSPQVKITDRGLVRVVDRAWEARTVR
ncbi:adenine deaminase C-terminal domain-containing protein [Marinitenerispora sediminis]|uniref:Adenine deaminase n=1 Tax=Marinitenerispora sediminis TaxID=1931232 RepID=A0A368T201_9ACTN|nr:adenine deaminase C-terminal domain-containing protein [Marinitenerispora sediminis]RCV54731.1 adenine deaminase [Marinitenerispora sediminis]RCV54982.1 adenine deaminase [Marinitenerispora sediminis]RCV59982.1 adenine deaminase [Marinitenerispora sediminis]